MYRVTISLKVEGLVDPVKTYEYIVLDTDELDDAWYLAARSFQRLYMRAENGLNEERRR